MSISLPLKEMSIADKLRAIEDIWDDLSHNVDNVPVPQWHLQELKRREELIANGEVKFIDWKLAKKQIREQTQ